MSDNLLLLFQESVVGTYTNVEEIIELSAVARLDGNVPLNLNLYDRDYGTPLDAYKAGFFEVLRVTSVNTGTKEITATRGQEGTTALTIGAGNWVVYQAINPKTITDKEDTFTKSTGFNKDFGTVAGTVAQGNELATKANLAGGNEFTGVNQFDSMIKIDGKSVPTLEQQDLAWEYWETVFNDGGSVGDMNLLARSL